MTFFILKPFNSKCTLADFHPDMVSQNNAGTQGSIIYRVIRRMQVCLFFDSNFLNFSIIALFGTFQNNRLHIATVCNCAKLRSRLNSKSHAMLSITSYNILLGAKQ